MKSTKSATATPQETSPLMISAYSSEPELAAAKSQTGVDLIDATLKRMGFPINEENRLILMFGPDGIPEESKSL